METKSEQVQSMARHLKLASMVDGLGDLLTQAKDGQTSYLDFAFNLLNTEVTYRNHQNFLKRQKSAKLPLVHDLINWKDNPDCGISLHQVAQLQECLWLEQNFNLMMLGPSGTGKSFLAAGLCHEALLKGYRACFRTMDQLNYLLKMKDITRSAGLEYALLLKTNLLVVDDIMMFPLEKKQAVGLFNLVDNLHQRASMIITTNKSPDEWVKLLDDEVLATAILDRLLFKCEIIRLSGKSYRMDHRQTYFS
jgi:DNA replication protein DnaC